MAPKTHDLFTMLPVVPELLFWIILTDSLLSLSRIFAELQTESQFFAICIREHDKDGSFAICGAYYGKSELQTVRELILDFDCSTRAGHPLTPEALTV